MNARQRFKRIKNYCLYYGQGRAEMMTPFDLAVVEPSGQDESGRRLLKDNGTLVAGYVSVLEFPRDRCREMKLAAGDLLCSGSTPLLNTYYNNKIMDPRSERCRQILWERASRLIEGQGYDGIFLDTIGDVEDERLAPDASGPVLIAAAKLVYDLRKTYPEHILIQNSGLINLWELTARYVDAFCWENFHQVLDLDPGQALAMARRLFRAGALYGPRTLLLAGIEGVSGRVKKYVEFAREMGFPIFLTQPGYTVFPASNRLI
ncbi:MAG: hypothetical protein BWY80_00121 [Firmicutes bacterium ADurb.Bin456]|nr:MAG: hypothetical protein BWY80_00121 [Firmicutes bacterium ADurb.Bin456]